MQGVFEKSVGSVSGVVASAGADKDAGVLEAKKALDVQKQQGDGIVRLIESTKVEGQKGHDLDVVA
jgi:hypothetical protein